MIVRYSSLHLDEMQYVQIARCYYVLKNEWYDTTPAERHIAICNCVSKRRKYLVFTGQSACAILGIPRLDSIDVRPHCITEKRKGSDFICWRYGKPSSHVEEIDGIFVVSPLRAILDLGKYDSTYSLLVSINHCLCKGLFTKQQLFNAIKGDPNRRWKKVIKRLLPLASNKCESPLETLAWIEINKAGFLIPEQQVNIMEKQVFKGRVDMYWEVRSRKIILELDGKIKYLGQNDLFDEKNREDELRELGYLIIRSTWKEVKNGKLIQKLYKANIPKRKYLKNSVLMKCA